MTKEIIVWDYLVRIFHWSLVLTFIICYFTGEEESLLHIYSGYAILGLIIFRIIWGFIGSQHARFKDFIQSPKVVYEYLKGLIKGDPIDYEGHNPAGGWMIIALLISLFITTATGIIVYDIEEQHKNTTNLGSQYSIISSAHADDDDERNEKYEENEENEENEKLFSHMENQENNKHDDSSEEFWEEIHEFFANFTVFLIILHILGVIVSSLLHKENLVKAMFTGKKTDLNIQ